MGSDRQVAVFGAYGHTGRFVVAELLERGYTPVLSGRDADKLKALAHGRAWRPVWHRPTTRAHSTAPWPVRRP